MTMRRFGANAVEGFWTVDARRVRWAADYLEGLPVAGGLKAMALPLV